MAFSTGQLGGASVPKGIHVVHSAFDDTNKTSTLTPYSFTNVNYGPAHSSRELIISVAVEGGISNAANLYVTVDGVIVTEKVYQQSTASSMVYHGRIALPTGTSGTIDVKSTSTISPLACAIFVHRVIRKTSGNTSSSVTTQSVNSNPYTTSAVTVPAGGISIGVVRISSLVSVTKASGVSSEEVLSTVYQSSADGCTLFSWYVDGTSKSTSSTPTQGILLSPGGTVTATINAW